MEAKKRVWWPFGWSHRDTIWLLVWTVTVSLLTMSFVLRDSATAMNLISFASTMVSIMLALVAIFYTMIQGSDTNQVMSMMRDKLDQVSSAQTSLLAKLAPIDHPFAVEPGLRNGPNAQREANVERKPVVEREPEKADQGQGERLSASRRQARKVIIRILLDSERSIPNGSVHRVTRDDMIDAAVLSGVPFEDTIWAIHDMLSRGELVQIIPGEMTVHPKLSWFAE